MSTSTKPLVWKRDVQADSTIYWSTQKRPYNLCLAIDIYNRRPRQRKTEVHLIAWADQGDEPLIDRIVTTHLTPDIVEARIDEWKAIILAYLASEFSRRETHLRALCPSLSQ